MLNTKLMISFSTEGLTKNGQSNDLLVYFKLNPKGWLFLDYLKDKLFNGQLKTNIQIYVLSSFHKVINPNS